MRSKTLHRRGPALALAVALGLTGCAHPVPAGSPDSEQLADPELLVAEACDWVRELRQRHRPHGRVLNESERAVVASYFSDALLDSVRVRIVGRLENPDFYDRYRAVGEPIPIDFSSMSGMAADDTVLIAHHSLTAGGAIPSTLLFHELVHVAQAHASGGDGYVADYVHGWLAAGSYRAIPQEAQAYSLASRFRSAAAPFSVEAEVAATAPTR